MSKASIARAASRVANKSKTQTRGMLGNRGEDGSLLSASADKALEPWSDKIDTTKDRLTELDVKLEELKASPEYKATDNYDLVEDILQEKLDIIDELRQEMRDSSLDIPRDLEDMRGDLIIDLHDPADAVT